ncbi:MAG: type III-B CRISPR module RAMP protein Cmr1 [Pseudomonadota bacterium]|nr:type III-B CRISPR module RAMP protein Cmr1 [Pseudomonadota bacterium]
MHILEATYQIVTPMFIGDAEQKAIDLRPPSVKGALRFWWRALNWRDFVNRYSDKAQALQALHNEEAKLFGIAAHQDVARSNGQGQFLLTLTPTHLSTLQPSSLPALKNKEGQSYLLGQGLCSHDKRTGHHQYLRSALKADQKFTVKLCSRTNAHHRSLAEALLLFGLLGGLGSRSRRGLGSVAIQSLTGCDNCQVPNNEEEYKTTLKSLLRSLPADLPPFTAFSEYTRVDISQTGRDAWNLLEDVGKKMNDYRSYRKARNFPTDHDLAADVVQGISVSTHPQRVVFGLPHNYFFTSLQGAKVDVQPGTSLDRSRRASPLFIHIHTFPKSRDYLAVQTLLPTEFLPSHECIEFKGKWKGKTFKDKVPVNVDWNVIENFMDRFGTKKVIIP